MLSRLLKSRTRPMDIVLGLILTVITTSSCTDYFEFEATATDLNSGRPVVSWDDELAREFTVYDCVDVCPPLSSLPNYDEAQSPFGDNSEVTAIWHLESVMGIETTTGALPSPVVFGILEDGVGYNIGEPADALAPGNYLTRIIVGGGGLFNASFGTAWLSFVIPE
jgi:hypothetical protein